MSRIIVKNLPDSIKASKLEKLFSSKGTITDLQLKYTKKGVFRKFAFVGFKSEEEATAAKEFFNNTYVKTSKIQVEFCKNLNDPSKPKPWKQLKEDHANKVKANKVHAEKEDQKKKKDKTKREKREEIDEELKNDLKFKEFLELQKGKKEKPIWAEELPDLLESEEDDDELPTKMKDDAKPESLQQNTEKIASETEVLPSVKCPKKIYDDSFTVKISNLPYNCKRKQLKSFLRPLKIVSLRYPPQNKGFAFVKFKTQNDMQKALIKHKGFLDGHCIYVTRYSRKPESVSVSNSHSHQKNEDPEKNLELLAETGKIFVRNLCFTVKESELENIFKRFGPLAEFNLPINSLTKQNQGIAFVSYVFAEHAVKAFTELDGTIFQGRVLHLLPANPKQEFEIDENETNYKKKKAMKMKSTSGSALTWNILFVDTYAVADVISEKYNIDKAKLLSGDSKEKVAVRLALAETQMVKENRDFLIKHGVQLDAFSQANTERSKTVIVVKHLPAKTKSEELNKLFSNFGTVNRLVMPPSGLAALVEFDNPTEAKAAFKKLAYSKFGRLPLYLEWAPIDCIKDPVDLPNKESEENEDQEIEKSEESITEDKIEDSEMGITLFVKNICFDTTDADFEKHFKKIDGVLSACISRRMDPNRGSLSMGFGFVKYKTKQAAVQALNNLQNSKLDGYALDLKFSNQASKPPTNTLRRKYEVKKQTSSKILIRNIPFEASENEIYELFVQFGQLNFVRLPKKLGGDGQHRGFGFVEYIIKEDAKRAFDALCHSTHFYGRRLVLEWANSDTEDVDELRKRTAKNFGEDVQKKWSKKSKLIEDVELATARHKREN